MKTWILGLSMGWVRVPVNMSAKSLWLFCWGFKFVHEGAEFKLLRFGSCTSGSTIMELERLRCSSKPKKMDWRSYCIDCSLHGKNNPSPVQPCPHARKGLWHCSQWRVSKSLALYTDHVVGRHLRTGHQTSSNILCPNVKTSTKWRQLLWLLTVICSYLLLSVPSSSSSAVGPILSIKYDLNT